MKSTTTALTCSICNIAGVIRHLPKEVSRRLDKETITIPGEAQPRTVTILRVTYRRDFLCPNCGQQWSEEYETEKQESA